MRAAIVAALLAVAAPAGARVDTNTSHVEGMVSDAQHLWVATRGGLERYRLADLARDRVYTSADGLPESWARSVAIVDGQLEVATERARCRLVDERLRCAPRYDFVAPGPRAAPTAHGRRVTAELRVGARRFVGTAGDGVWLEDAAPHRLTPPDRICSNHVVAIVEHRGEVWLGSFDEGLCKWTGDRYAAVPTPFRMVNRLLSTPRGLLVGANEGLFLSTDGASFTRVMHAPAGGWNGLALDGATVWATTPLALYRFSVSPRGLRLRATWERPGGSTALQGVTTRGGFVWIASEDRGVLRTRGRAVTFLDRAAGLPSSWVMDVVGAGDAVYAATLRDGLARIDDDGRVTPVAGPYPWLLHLSSDGETVWVGAQGGALAVGRGEAAARALSAPGLPHQNVYAIAKVGGALVLATEGGLLTLPCATASR